MDDTEWGDFESSGSLQGGIPAGYGAAPGPGTIDHGAHGDTTSIGSGMAAYDSEPPHFSNATMYSDFAMEWPIGYNGYGSSFFTSTPTISCFAVSFPHEECHPIAFNVKFCEICFFN
jgi:hypothetical protein